MKKLLAIACMASVLFASCEKIGGNEGTDGKDPAPQKPRFEKADINDYEVIETKGYKFVELFSQEPMEITFDILDRNLGATAAYDPAANAEAKKAAIGDYYQFGNSVPVGTADQLNNTFDPANTGELEDWSKPENTPCPEGWRIPTPKEIDMLASALFEDEDMMTDATQEQVDAAAAFAAKIKLPLSGYWRVKQAVIPAPKAGSGENVETELSLTDAMYFWGSNFSLDEAGNKVVNDKGMLVAPSFENYRLPHLWKSSIVTYAMPIRCVR